MGSANAWTYSALKEDIPVRLAEAERVGYGFVLPVPVVPRKRWACSSAGRAPALQARLHLT
jgi:hypothetical protein